MEGLTLKFEKAKNWKAFYAILDLLIQGIVLFPNINDFMDHLVVEVFLYGNPVPFLLDDIYYAFHECHEKKGGALLCCALVLHAWIMTHMPKWGLFISKELRPSKKLAFITTSTIKWYIRDWKTKCVIVNCGDFHNVPLIGTVGCINYNPFLSTRQLGYPMDDLPKVKSLDPFILHDVGADNQIMKKIKRFR